MEIKRTSNALGVAKKEMPANIDSDKLLLLT